MIVEGLKLTLLGMMVVFSFLFLLLIIIQVSVRLLKGYTEKEASLATVLRPSRLRPSKIRTVTPDDDSRKRIAIISAAIAAHRTRMGHYKLP